MSQAGARRPSEADASRFVHTPFPQQVVVEVTTACDQRCVFCGRTYLRRPKGRMRRELFEKIVEEIGRESPYTELWPTFMGEALLLGNRLFEFIRHARQAGCRKITLNSNGNRLTPPAIEGLLSCGLDRFIISCDGHTKETYERIRVGGRFERLYGGANLLLESMRRQGLTRPLIEMQFSVFDENEHETEAFTRYWLERGAVVKVRPKVHWSGIVAGGPGGAPDDPDRLPCPWAMDTCALHWNGDIVMCAIDCEGKYVAGNMAMTTLRESWNGRLKAMRELHLHRRFRDLPEVCRGCGDWRVKKAVAFFPSQEVRREYEATMRLGRVFMQDHPVRLQELGIGAARNGSAGREHVSEE